ncbi:MAG: glutamine--tRNA ligase, partial [Lachnospiraceae bacterium]|nr:glutamine--tRNA ligase [Lachnospiraceae bacterium]
GFEGRKVKGTIHWVSASHATKCEARLYEQLVDEERNINPNSLTVREECYVEPALAEAKPYDRFQFVRQGYFSVDPKDSVDGKLVFNRIVSLKSSFKLPS